ncbi:acetyltransferase [Tenacibaculum sp. M341]|uniref:acetyltransferase n=1 Tax=Tenacibaculum sp. M341 TaxID=2530339 RepID=UPI00104B9CC2|nr:acetyltransferase [Tenacibaculum sp. M341]TCI91877.1 acetyltransferase [Tenacibaculum sp. M341]
MIYSLINLLAIVGAIILGLRKNGAFINPQKYFQQMSTVAFITGTISGVVQGTAYSHGFDFYWWMFSILSFIIIMIISIIVIGIGYIKRSIKRM